MAKLNDVPILIRRTHEERILGALRAGGPSTRAELERRVGLSRTTVSEIAGSLLARGALVEIDPASGPRRRGRPAVRLALEPSSGQLLGVDLGHRRVYVAAVNASNEVIGSGVREYAMSTSWSERLDLTTSLADQIRAEHDLSFGALEAVGVGVPGPVSSALLADSRVPDRWQGMSRDAVIDLVRNGLQRHFGARVVIDNNTRFAGLAEAVWGAHRNLDSLLYVRLSDGVGGALVVGGRLVSGAGGTAGEVGHVEVESDGRACWCGKRGCLETVASVPAMLDSIRAADPTVRTFAAAVARCEEPAVGAVLAHAAAALGRTLAATATVLDPQDVVVAGEALRFGEAFLGPARAAFDEAVLPDPRRRGRLRATSLRDEAGALGALTAAYRRSPLLAGYADLAAESSRPTVPRPARAKA
jgi:predicted NBD/HSP70 family sugar kinase